MADLSVDIALPIALSSQAFAVLYEITTQSFRLGIRTRTGLAAAKIEAEELGKTIL